jgi:deoxycytidylate deaminase
MKQYAEKDFKMGTIDEKFRNSIVIGLVGRIGTDFDAIFNSIKQAAEANTQNYQVNLIHVSDLVINEVGKEDCDTLWKKIKECNEFVGEKGPESLVDLINKKVKSFIRKHNDKNYIFVIRSLKRLDELKHLQRIYGRSFYSIGLYTSLEKSLYSIEEFQGDKDYGDLVKLVQNSEQQKDSSGQNLQKVMPYCDYYINMSGERKIEVGEAIKRLLKVIFGCCFEPPTPEEIGMDYAFTAAVRSVDQSRQVGCCVMDKNNRLLVTGTNGVPKYGGGIAESFGEDDPNTKIKKKELDKIIKCINDLCLKIDLKKFKSCLKKETGLMDILEYSNSLHAEQDAIGIAAKDGILLKGGVLYVSTFPCHLCTKLIIASGIEKVVYLYPYPKSRALELHSDAMSLENEKNKVFFKHFEGFSPYRFLEFFSWGKREDEKGESIQSVKKLKLGHVKINSLRGRMNSVESTEDNKKIKSKEEGKPDYNAQEMDKTDKK